MIDNQRPQDVVNVGLGALDLLVWCVLVVALKQETWMPLTQLLARVEHVLAMLADLLVRRHRGLDVVNFELNVLLGAELEAVEDGQHREDLFAEPLVVLLQVTFFIVSMLQLPIINEDLLMAGSLSGVRVMTGLKASKSSRYMSMSCHMHAQTAGLSWDLIPV